MRRRRAIAVFIVGAASLVLFALSLPPLVTQTIYDTTSTPAKAPVVETGSAMDALEQLSVKGRAPKVGYERAQFGDGWSTVQGCSTRTIILNRDLHDVVVDDECRVVSGVLNDPYSGEVIVFSKDQSSEVQIDHVVALSDAWQKGAQQLSSERRKELANDPLELLAVSGSQNQAKGDGDAATWLPKNKSFRCSYVARQIAVKQKYALWVTQAEKDAMATILGTCPNQALPTP